MPRKKVAQISETKVDEPVEPAVEVEHVCKCPTCHPVECQERGTASSYPAHMCQNCYREQCVEYVN